MACKKVGNGMGLIILYMTKIIKYLLQNPSLWALSQKIFGDDKEKMKLYRSVIKHKCKILDFGCSNGNTFPVFADYDYYGYDTDPVMILNAKQKYKEFRNAHFYTLDILKDKSPKQNFDYILFALTGHHLNDNTLIKIFRKLSILLKRGGRIAYFDSIRVPKKDSLLLTVLLNMDQGKFIRTLEEYDIIKRYLPKELKVRKSKTYQINKTLMPQPKYIFWELERV